MSTTVGTLEKKVETVLENLTPEEKAKYLYDKTWDIANRQANGSNEEAHWNEIKNFFHRHVATLGARDYIAFLTADDNLNTRKWAGMYFSSQLAGLDREDALIALLLFEKERIWINEILKPDKVKEDPVWKERLERDREQIKGLRNRKRAIFKEIKEILEADFWEKWEIERPQLELPDSEEFLTTIEEVETRAAKRDLS